MVDFGCALLLQTEYFFEDRRSLSAGFWSFGWMIRNRRSLLNASIIVSEWLLRLEVHQNAFGVFLQFAGTGCLTALAVDRSPAA